MSVHTITMSPQQISALEKQLQGCEKRKTPPYARYQYRLSDCVITAYESGKVVFQGEGADLYAAPFAQARPKAAATISGRWSSARPWSRQKTCLCFSSWA